MAYTTIDNPELYFQAKLHTGNATNRSITLDGSEDMQPDFVWIKERGGSNNHELFDAVRGATKRMYSDIGNAEDTGATTLTSFDSDGFSLGTGNPNNNTDTYVSWCWKESADAGFDIVGYSGNETNRTISHSLSAVPHVMIIKNRESAYQWVVYHHKNTSAPETDYLYLSATDATGDFDGHFNDTAPTSSVFTVGTDVGVNKSSQDHINYLWSEKQGFSKFGSYVGNGNADGTFVYTGFRPAWVMIKKSNSSGTDWIIHDAKRDVDNIVQDTLYANLANAESDYDRMDFTAQGFKCRNTSTAFNASGDTYIYMAFAEAPFVNSNGVPCNAR